MTILDQINAKSRSIVQDFVDKEPINYIEAGLMHQIVINGRYNVSFLSVLYNHAKDEDLKQLIKDAIDNLTENTIKYCETFLQEENAVLPTIRYPEYSIGEVPGIPDAAHIDDSLIAMTLVSTNTPSQIGLITAMNQCYHLEIAFKLRKQINTAMDWSYRLLQLMLHKGWLPEIAKIQH